MATCPHCLGPLSDDHHCPRTWRRRVVRLIGPPLAGSVLGVVACYGLIDRPHVLVVVSSALLGGLLADALRRAVVSRV